MLPKPENSKAERSSSSEREVWRRVHAHKLGSGVSDTQTNGAHEEGGRYAPLALEAGGRHQV